MLRIYYGPINDTMMDLSGRPLLEAGVYAVGHERVLSRRSCWWIWYLNHLYLYSYCLFPAMSANGMGITSLMIL